MPKLLADGPDLLALALELPLVLLLSVPLEHLRSYAGPQTSVGTVRRLGRRAGARSEAQRERLRRAIRWVDRRLFAEPNCYRRILLEIALDAGAAREKVMMGFREGGGAGSGHAWLESDPPVTSYDAVVSL